MYTNMLFNVFIHACIFNFYKHAKLYRFLLHRIAAFIYCAVLVQSFTVSRYFSWLISSSSSSSSVAGLALR